MLTKNAIGNMQNRYIAVLKKCRLLNTFGSLAVVGMLAMGACGMVGAEGLVNDAWAGDIKNYAYYPLTGNESGSISITDNGSGNNLVLYGSGIYTATGTKVANNLTIGDGYNDGPMTGNVTLEIDGDFSIGGDVSTIGTDDYTGTLQVVSGVTTVGGKTNIESGGSLIVESNGIYNASGQSVTIESGGSLIVSGETILSSDGTAGTNGLYAKELTNSGSVNVGTLTVASDGTLDNSSGSISGGSLTVESGATVYDGDLGTLTLTGTLTLGQNYTASGDNLDVSGIEASNVDLTIQDASSLEATGTVNIANFTVSGENSTATFSGTTTVSGATNIESGGTLTNNDTFNIDTLTIASGGKLDNSSGSISGGSLEVTSDATFVDLGTLDLTGTLTLGQSYTASEDNLTVNDVSGAGIDLRIENASSLTASGSVELGTLTVGGGTGDSTATFSGTTTVSGATDIESSGSLIIKDSGEYNASDETTIKSSGSLTVESGGAYNASGQSVTIESGGSLIVSGETILSSDGTAGTNGLYAEELTNSGSVNIDTLTIASGGTLDNSSGSISGANLEVTSDATSVDLGTLTLTDTLTLGQSYIASRDTLDVVNISASGIDLTIEDASSLTASGSVELENLNIASGGSVTNNGVVEATTLTVASSGTLDNSSGSISGGSLTVENGATSVDLGTLDLTGTLTLGQNYTASGDNLDVSGIEASNVDLTIQDASSLEATGTVNIANFTVSGENSTATFSGTTTVSGATDIESGGTLTNNGTFNIDTLTVASDGTLDNSNGSISGANLEVASNATSVDLGTLNLSGTLTLKQDYTASGDSLTVNDVSGAGIDLTIGDASSLTASGSVELENLNIASGGTLDNSSGSISGANLEVTSDATSVDLGTLTLTDTLTLGQNYTASGDSLTVNNISASGITLTIGDASSLTASGSVELENLNIASGGSVTNNGVVEATTLTVASSGTLDNSSGSISGGSLTVENGATSVDLGTLNLSGTLTLKQDYTASGDSLDVGGIEASSADLTIQDASSLEASGTVNIANFTVSGENSTATFSGTTTTTDTTTVASGGSLTVNGGTYKNTSGDTKVSGSLTVDGGTYTNSSCTFIYSGGSLTVENGGEYTNSHDTEVFTGGSLTVNDGTYQNTGGYTSINGELTVESDGIYNASGQNINVNAMGTLSNSGVVYVGTLTVASGGELDNSSGSISGGSLEVTSDATISNVDLGTLNLSGTLTLGQDYTASGDNLDVGGIEASSADLTIQDASSLEASGTVNIANFTVSGENSTATFSGTTTVSGTTSIDDGELTVNFGGIYNAGSDDASWIDTELQEASLAAADYAILAIYAANSISSSGTLTVGDSTSTSNMNFGDNSLLVVNAEALGTSYALTADSISVGSGASLLVSNITFDSDKSATVYIASTTTSLEIANGAWGYDGASTDGTETEIDFDSNNLYFDNAFTDYTVSYTYIEGEGGTYTLTLAQISAEEVIPDADDSLNESLDEGNTDDGLPDFIKQASLISDKKKAAATIEGAAKMSVCAGILSSLASLDGLGASVVQARSSFKGAANMSTSTISQKDTFLASNSGSFSDTPTPVISDAGTAGGMLNGFALWLQPMYKSTSADGFTSGSFEYGYDTTILGVSLGADYTVGNSLRFGLAFHSGNGETESSSDSDFNYTEDDFEYAGLTFYSAYVHNNLSLALDMGYIATTNDVTQKTTIGNLYTGDFTAGVLSLGLRSEYKVATSFLDLIPYVGARFSYFEIESFDTKDSNGVVYENKASYASTFGIPVGINVTKALVDDGVTYTPRATLGMQFTMGDLDVEQRVSIPNISGSASMESEIFDPVTFMGGIGLGVAKENVTFALDYTIGASEHTTSHQVMATFGYRF